MQNKWQIHNLLQYSKIQILFAICKEKGIFHYQINKFTILVTNNILIDGKGASGSTGLNIVWVRFCHQEHFFCQTTKAQEFGVGSRQQPLSDKFGYSHYWNQFAG